MLWVFLLSTLLAGVSSDPVEQSVILKDDGSYHFSFDTGEEAGSHAREESRQPDGTVIGKYSYKDTNGALRLVNYRAGRQGFVASGDVGAVGSPPAQFPAQVPEVPPEIPDVTVTTSSPVSEGHVHTVEVKPSTTETPASSPFPPKVSDDEEAHAPPVDPSDEEESPIPFAAPPFGKRRLGDESIKPDDKDISAPVDPSNFYYGFGSPISPQYFSRNPYSSYGSGLASHPFYAPGTSPPQAPVWNYVPQQQPAIKINSQGEHPGVFDVPPYWKRRLQDPNDIKEEDDKYVGDGNEAPVDEPEKFHPGGGSPVYPTLIRTSYIPHTPGPSRATPTPTAAPTAAPKRKVVSRFFIYVPVSQNVPYWGYGPSGSKGQGFNYEQHKQVKESPIYSPNYWSYQPHSVPYQQQFPGPWNSSPHAYGSQHNPWTFFSRAIPVTPSVQTRSSTGGTPSSASYYPQVRPAVQHYAYKGPSNTYGYFYQY